MISVFYEADDGSRVRLLDVGCEANPGSSEQNIHSRLEGIEARLVCNKIITRQTLLPKMLSKFTHLVFLFV